MVGGANAISCPRFAQIQQFLEQGMTDLLSAKSSFWPLCRVQGRKMLESVDFIVKKIEKSIDFDQKIIA